MVVLEIQVLVVFDLDLVIAEDLQQADVDEILLIAESLTTAGALGLRDFTGHGHVSVAGVFAVEIADGHFD